MTPDKLARLAAIQEKLVDVLCDEADPDQWPGAGRPLGEIEKTERGDRYWCKKNAAATVMLTERIMSLRLAMQQGPEPADGEAAPDFDSEIQRYEKEAAKQLAKFRAKALGGRA